MNSNHVCPEGRNVIRLYIAINISTTQHFPTVYCTSPTIFGKQACTAISVAKIPALQGIFFKTHNTVFHGIHQFIHLRSLNVRMTNYQLQFPHLWLYSPSSFNVFLLIK